jgi:DNA-binding transcriptional MocR family regulator
VPGRHGDRIASLPGHDPLGDGDVLCLGLVPVGVPLDEDGPLPGETVVALREARAAILTPRAQNPTGSAISRTRSRELARAFAEHPDVVLIENDHGGLVAGAPHFPIRRRDGPWAVVRSVSKTLSPDLRPGFAAGDAETIARVHGRQLLGAGWVSLFVQEIVAAVARPA